MVKIQPMSTTQIQELRLLKRLATTRRQDYERASVHASQEERACYLREIDTLQKFIGVAELTLRYGGFPVDDSPRQVTKSAPTGGSFYAQARAEKIRQLATR